MTFSHMSITFYYNYSNMWNAREILLSFSWHEYTHCYIDISSSRYHTQKTLNTYNINIPEP